MSNENENENQNTNTITYEFVAPNVFSPFFRANRDKIFTAFDFDVEQILSSEEKMKRKENRKVLKDAKHYCLVAKAGDQIIGWSFGRQRDPEEFYMTNSAVFEAYRRQGVYTELMRLAVERITEMGFQRIYSHHKMSNNSILIAKLKFGFVITGMKVDDVFGNLVVLSYYTNETRRKLLQIRMGTRKMDEEATKLVK